MALKISDLLSKSIRLLVQYVYTSYKPSGKNRNGNLIDVFQLLTSVFLLEFQKGQACCSLGLMMMMMT
jgi:hypothetical protein